MKVLVSPSSQLGWTGSLLGFFPRDVHCRPCWDWCVHLGQEASKLRVVELVLQLQVLLSLLWAVHPVHPSRISWGGGASVR